MMNMVIPVSHTGNTVTSWVANVDVLPSDNTRSHLITLYFSKMYFFMQKASKYFHSYLKFMLGTKVTQVVANDTESDEILYEIGSGADGKFGIDRTTGWITSNVIFDREVWFCKLWQYATV